MKIIVELSTTGMLDCWDIWYELSFGRASPILFGRRSKNPTSWASIFCSSAGEWEEEKSHFLKGLLCQKCLEYPAKLHLHTLLHIHALCTYYSTIVHCFGGFLKTCTQWWSFHLNFLWSWIPFFVGKRLCCLQNALLCLFQTVVCSGASRKL